LPPNQRAPATSAGLNPRIAVSTSDRLISTLR
jgi:hypothetical protein